MEKIDQVLSLANSLMENSGGVGEIELPALREVMEHVILAKDEMHGYSKHSDHSKSSTKGCALGCIGG